MDQSTIRVIKVETFGGPEGLKLSHAPQPVAGPGEAVVAVEAAGVGLVDVMVRQGIYAGASQAGIVPGVEVAGTVVDAPGEASDWRGRRVFVLVGGGGYADRVKVATPQLIALPDSVTSADAVALGVNALTASFALRRANLIAGERVLVRGASGGIGVMGVQLAARAGALVTAVTSSEESGRRLLELGAQNVLNRTSGEVEYDEYDVILDPVGGAEVSSFVSRLRPNGRYVICGAAAGFPSADFGMSLVANFGKSPAILAVSLSSTDGAELASVATEIFAAAGRGELRPMIDEALPLHDAVAAHEKLEAGGVFGKLILVP